MKLDSILNSTLDSEAIKKALDGFIHDSRFLFLKPKLTSLLGLVNQHENSYGDDVMRFFTEVEAFVAILRKGDINAAFSFQIKPPIPLSEKERIEAEHHASELPHNSSSYPVDFDEAEEQGEGLRSEMAEYLWARKEDMPVEYLSMIPVDEQIAQFRLAPALMPRYIWELWNRGFSVSERTIICYNLHTGIRPGRPLLSERVSEIMVNTVAFSPDAGRQSQFYFYSPQSRIHTLITPGFHIRLEWLTSEKAMREAPETSQHPVFYMNNNANMNDGNEYDGI